MLFLAHPALSAESGQQVLVPSLSIDELVGFRVRTGVPAFVTLLLVTCSARCAASKPLSPLLSINDILNTRYSFLGSIVDTLKRFVVCRNSGLPIIR